MLLAHKSLLNSLTIVLASQSPRRQELLRCNLGFENLHCIPSRFAEDIEKATCASPEDYVSKTSLGKLRDLIGRREELSIEPDMIISADTIVVGTDNSILEKPFDRDHAIRMLTSLSGKRHQVMTAVSIGVKKKRTGASDGEDTFSITSFVEKTDVFFANLKPEDISSYVDSGEPFDKGKVISIFIV